MSAFDGLRRWFRLPETRDAVPGLIAEEISFHLERRVEVLMARGMDARSARLQAEREFGDIDAAHRELTQVAERRVRRSERLALHDALVQDVRQAFRQLRRDPLFAVPVIVTLGLALGANATMFGITDHLLLRAPPHVQDPATLVAINHRLQSDGDPVFVIGYSYPDYAALRDDAPAFEQVAAYSTVNASTGRGEQAERRRVLVATASFFPALGVQPEVGRFFDAAEDTPGRAERLVELSHAYWQQQYGGMRSAIGQFIEIGNDRYEIVGVAPEGFRGLDLVRVDLIVPVSAYAASTRGGDWNTRLGWSWLTVVGRLASEEHATAAAEQATRARELLHPEYGQHPVERAVLVPADPRRVPKEMRFGAETRTSNTMVVLLGMSVIVLLIASANVANLLLARALRRSRELGIRVALGVSRGRLIGMITIEAALLAMLGGLAGLVLTKLLGNGLRLSLLPDVAWPERMIDPRLFAFSALLMLLCLSFLGLLPAWQVRSTDVNALLKAGARDGGGRRQHLRRALVVLQAALCVVLLVGAGLFVRSLQMVRNLDLGFDTEDVVAMSWDTRALNRTPEEWALLYDDAATRLRALPQVRSVAIASSVPFQSYSSTIIGVPGRDSLPPAPGHGPFFVSVEPGYFATAGTRILAGRGFDARDVTGGAVVAVVDEAFAAYAFPGASPIGRCFTWRDACVEVVGIAENAMRHGLTQVQASPQFFVPAAQAPPASRALFIRLAPGTDAEAVIASLRSVVQRIDPQLPFVNLRTLETVVEPQVRPWRIGSLLFAAFGALAVVVTALGLYSVVAYNVAARRREMCIRLAVGSRARQLMRLVLSDTSRMLLLGLALGLAAARLAAPFIRDLLYQVTPGDATVYTAVGALVLLIGLLAAAVPARRATRVDPAMLLREE